MNSSFAGGGRGLDEIEIPTCNLGLEFLGERPLASASEGEVPRLWMAAY